MELLHVEVAVVTVCYKEHVAVVCVWQVSFC